MSAGAGDFESALSGLLSADIFEVDEEMLAEAYALFVTDPVFVKSVSPDMYKWFEEGEFLTY